MPGPISTRSWPICSVSPCRSGSASARRSRWGSACGCRPRRPASSFADRRLPELAGWLNRTACCRSRSTAFPTAISTSTSSSIRSICRPGTNRPGRNTRATLIAILHGLLPAGLDGQHFHVAAGVGKARSRRWSSSHQAATVLAELAEHLAQFEQDTGRLIHVDLEPEPGCILQRSGDVVRFFENYLLLPGRDENVLRRHVRVCHDICHAAVMFEEQTDVLKRYQDGRHRRGQDSGIQRGGAGSGPGRCGGACGRAAATGRVQRAALPPSNGDAHARQEPRSSSRTCTWPWPARWPSRRLPCACIFTCRFTSTSSAICRRRSGHPRMPGHRPAPGHHPAFRGGNLCLGRPARGVAATRSGSRYRGGNDLAQRGDLNEVGQDLGRPETLVH